MRKNCSFVDVYGEARYRIGHTPIDVGIQVARHLLRYNKPENRYRKAIAS